MKSPSYILDFHVSKMDNDKIAVSYFDMRISGNVELLLESRFLAKWIEEEEYNVLVSDTEVNGVNNQAINEINSMLFLELHLEEKHVLEYLKEKGIIK